MLPCLLPLFFLLQNKPIAPMAISGLASFATTTCATLLLDPPAQNKPNLEISPSTLMAPCAIHVRALLQDDPTAQSSRHVALQCHWTFGDPTSPTNDLHGFNAAHLYQTPGTYTITLQTADRESKQQIVIAPDHRLRIFLSTSGNDSHDGLTPETAVATAQQALKLLTDNSKLLLHRGDTFDLTKSITIEKHNIVLAAYGDGADPVLRKAAPNLNDLINVSAKASDVVIEDLCFDSLYKKDLNKPGGSRGVYVAGTNTAIHHVTFANVSDAVNAELSPHFLLIEDCVAPAVTSIRGYLLWAEGSNIVVLHNRAPNSTREHIIRVGGADHVLIEDNNFANIDRKSDGDKDDIAKGTIVFQKGSYLCAYNNRLTSGPLGIGPLGGPDGTRDADARTTNVIVENNKIDAASIYINAGVAHARFENNTIHYDGDVDFIIRPQDHSSPLYADRTAEDIQILGNKAINNAPTGRFLLLTDPTALGAITLTGNTFLSPHYETGHHESAAMFIADTDLKSFHKIENNTWPTPEKSHPEGALFYLWPKWYDERGYLTMEQWGKLPQVKGERN